MCLALTPRSNHFWNIAFQVNSRGFSTPVLRYHERSITMVFDFIKHELEIVCADGEMQTIKLQAKSVSAFYQELMDCLKSMGIEPKIWKMPVEFADPIAFDKDQIHHSYDPAMASAHHQVLLSVKPVMEAFRCEFIGKCSPVHFFWGSFDLAVTRFSGKRAPAKPEMGDMYAEAYSHEVISHGFWPGSGPVQEAAFYAYAVPEAAGFSAAKIEPAAAYYHQDLHEYILPYEAVRTAPSPEDELMKFMRTTYDSAANLGGWDRANLERKS